jgi:drug/metabolite transporter (DMT)-like permease
VDGHGARFGDFLALAGAWMMAGYLLVGRRLRAHMPLVPYAFLVYGLAAAFLVIAILVRGGSVPALPGRAWLWIVLLGLIPQLIGHSTFNWALRHLPASRVAIPLLAEPVGSATLAYLFLGEGVTLATVAGAVLVLAGVAIAARGTPALAPAAS